MTNFNEQVYKDRMRMRGTPAERQFVVYAKKMGWHGAKYGFEQGVEHFWKVPEVIRATPDFVISSPVPMLVEVKGCGKDGIIKLKERDLTALESWNHMADVWFFFYDSHRKRVSFQAYPSINEVVMDSDIVQDIYPDNNALYYKLPVDKIKWEKIE